MAFFCYLQVILLIFMLFHDWIPIPPLNDIKALRAADGDLGRLINALMNGAVVFIPLLITLHYYHSKIQMPQSALLTILIFYLLLTIGTIFSWWLPYFWGSSSAYKQHFLKFKHTHHFLSPRGDNIIPNTLHVILHIQVWLCLIFTIYFLMHA